MWVTGVQTCALPILAGDKRTIELKGKKFYILGNSTDDQYLTIGIPETTDENGLEYR